MASILDQIRDQVNKLSPDEVKAQLAKMTEQKAKQASRNAERNASPEAKAKRQEYNKTRNQNPEVVAKRKAYHERPEVKERMKQYRTKRNDTIKALMARAKELGFVPSSEAGGEQSGDSGTSAS
jgi:hypothetical protein